MPIASVEIKSIAEDYTMGLALRFFRGRRSGGHYWKRGRARQQKIEGRDRDLLR